MATTLAEMVIEVKDCLEHEKVEKLPSIDTLRRALNRAKNDAVASMEQVDPLMFLQRLDYTVDSGDEYIELPGYGDDTYQTVSTLNPWRRIIGLTQVQGETEINVAIYDRRDDGLKRAAPGFWMYREANRLYFHESTGAPAAMTLRLRYAESVPDLDGTDSTSSYERIPTEWTDLIVIRAILDLLPAGNAGRYKYERRHNDRLALLRSAAERTVNQGGMHVRFADDWY